LSGGHEAGLLNWTNSLRLAAAPRLTRTYVMAVPPAVSRLHIWKCRAVVYFVDVDAVADARSKLYGVGQNTGYDAGGNIHHVIVETASVWEASVVTCQEPQALLAAGRRRRNAGVQSE